ncbi:MAG: HepT-like ribonuclease domain-containing protein [Sulfurimonas sp.]
MSQAIEDKILKPAIRMHIIKIAEQFNKLKDDNAFDVLEKFSSNDLKGISAVRNFIAHDYDSVDDSIIEDVLRINMPIIKAVVVKELGLS